MLNRFNRFSARDYSWQKAIPEFPELNVQLLDETMNNVQSGITQSNALSLQQPKVLNNKPDLELYQEYKKSVDEGLANVTNAYATKGFRAGQSAYNQFLQQVKNDWQAGGRASILNDRFDKYNNALKEIESFAKDDERSINTNLARFELQEQLSKPIDFNPETNTYNSITTPELNKDPNLRKAIDEMLKQIEADGTTSFLGDFNRDWWIKKIKTETKSANKIQIAAEALMSQPEFQNQLQRDVRYKMFTTDKNAYEKQFTKQQENQYQQLVAAAKTAKSNPQKTKDWQNFLREQGYNLDVDGQYGQLTKQATEDFLSKSKSQEFNFDKQIQQEVTQSYLDYATRAAYKKVDTDPIFNQAVKWRQEAALKREENKINRDRLNFEFQEREGSSVTVVSGLSQQLPDLQKQIKETKESTKLYEQQMNDALKKSAFNGWTLENIATAYDKWDNAKGNTLEEKTRAFKEALNQNGSFQFDESQVNLLVEQMMQPENESSIKTMLSTYSDLQDEATRFDDVQNNIAEQYLNTAEGKTTLGLINQFRQSGESDKQLLNRVISNPDEFKTTNFTSPAPGGYVPSSRNIGKEVVSKMESDIKKQEKAGNKYEFGSLGTYEVYANKNNKTLKPVLDGISSAVTTGTGYNFSSFGQIGLQFKDNKNNTLDGSGVKTVKNVGIAKNSKGKPIIKMDINFTNEQGKSVDGYTEIDIIPGSPEQLQIIDAMEQSYIEQIKSGNPSQAIAAQGTLDLIESLKGKDGSKQAAVDISLKNLNRKNALSKPVFIESTINNNKELVNIERYGWGVVDLGMDTEISGRKVKTYGVNTKTGNFAASVITDENGYEYFLPNDKGEFLFPSTSGVAKNLTGMEIKSRASVIEK